MELIEDAPPEKVYEKRVGERRIIAVLAEGERGEMLTVYGGDVTIHEACRIRDELGPEVPWDRVHRLPRMGGWFFQREPWWQSEEGDRR